YSLLCCSGEDPVEKPGALPGGVPLGEERVDPKAPSIRMDREHQLYDQQEEISPRPLARCVVEAEPQIEDLQSSDHRNQAGEQTAHERYPGQHFGRVDDWREEVEVCEDDVVDEIGL